MNNTEAEERIGQLSSLIEDYRYQYYVLDKPTVSDAVYDSLSVELRELEAQYPDLVRTDSPTQRVGAAPLTKFASVAHTTPMLSLNDVFSVEEVEDWVKRSQKLLGHAPKSYYGEIKMDGLAASVIYENGILVRGLTRGDGRTGEDVTTNIRTIEQVPLKLRRDPSVPSEVYEGVFEVRGEVLMYKSVFAALNEKQAALGKPLFANPRNTAAGSIRQLDPRLVADRQLSFHVYAVATPVPGVETHADEHDLAAKLGFKVEPHSAEMHSLTDIKAFIEQWQEARKELPYGTDGLVFTIDQREDYLDLGVVGKAPRGAIAYKFPAEQATTKLNDIKISIGRTGAATPFAVLEPVLVAGSTVGMATLHNESEIARKDIRIGDTVIVQKAGDIIPEVVGPLTELRNGSEIVFKMPTNCTDCGEALVKSAKEAIWRCVNFDCPALARGRIIHFASKGAMDIDGVGESTVDALLDARLVEDVADLYALTYEQVVSLDRFADISARKLIAAIDASRTPELGRFIFALGIRHTGAQTARDLADHFGSFDKFKAAKYDDIVGVPGIGPIVAESIAGWLSSERHQSLLAKFEQYGVRPVAIERATGPLTGVNFVITGTLDMGSRDEVAARLEALGAKSQNAVTKDTTYLIIGDAPGASKVTKAEKLGTAQIDETAVEKLLAS